MYGLKYFFGLVNTLTSKANSSLDTTKRPARKPGTFTSFDHGNVPP